jgi:hypothetical protein
MRRRWSLVCLVLGSAGMAASGAIHLQLWAIAYSEVAVIGPLFLLDAVFSWLIALVLLAFRHPLVAAAGILMELGAIAGLALATTTALFGFHESGAGVGGQIAAAYGTESLAAVMLVASLALRRTRPREMLRWSVSARPVDPNKPGR